MGIDDLLTTRQLQDLLQVDRITIYRMLNDGRLSGFKVGGQWRFSRQEVEKWLQEQRAALPVDALPDDVDNSTLSAHPLPLSCVQAIQSVYAEALGIAAVATEPDGTPLTDVSNSGEFCNLILSTEEGRVRCAASWRVPDDMRSSPPLMRTCHAGLLCVSVPIKVEEEWVASVASCQFVAQPADGDEAVWWEGLLSLVGDLGLDERALQAAVENVRLLAGDQVSRIPHLLEQVAATLAEIGQERQKLVNRLRRIAAMTEL